MPPKRGIVKSGNSGNSSKAAPLPDKSVPKDGEEDEKKPLFPFGSKYPMSLLHERFVNMFLSCTC
jgi:ATP-dependent RNA helicase DHX57